MQRRRQWGGVALAMLAGSLLAACEPEVGSKAWCDAMNQKPKGDWTANQAGDYAKHCIFNSGK